ncbi:MAG: winged helix-turn-helix domain-containing protein [Ktedonobacteraceae bacterium]|nr:winged helix-turn-helix domain-containing protein [Ktedonobacteraceae bacterium]
MQSDYTATPHPPVPHAQPDRASPTHIRIYTFGPLHIEWIDQQRGCANALCEEHLAIKDATAALWLLKLLLSQPHRFALRDEIMEHFWPEVSSTAAAKRLDNVVYALRKLLRPPGSTHVLLLRQGTPANGNGYQLAAYPHIWVDADAFTWNVEQAARLERFGEEALSLWEVASQLAARGTYLVEERYSPWAMPRRARLEGQHRQCVHRLATLYRQHGHHALAELRLHTYWQAHPTDEDALRPLLELLGEQERYQEAEACYQQALEALQEEGRDPDARTQEIAEYLRAKQITRRRVRGEHSALEHASIIGQEPLLPAESGVLVPAHLVLDPSPRRVEVCDWPSWFSEQVDVLKGVLAGWQEQQLACSHVQALLHEQIERWNTMSDQAGKTSSDVLLGRRLALTTLATVSAALLTKVQAGPLTALLLEEFLAQCSASITACWHLLRGDGLSTVEYVLPKYLPVLTALIQQLPTYKQKSAYLAAQGYLLLGLVALHRLRFFERVACCKQAVEYAHVAGDQTLLVTALTHLGDAFYTNGQRAEMLQTCQQALLYSDVKERDDTLPLLVRSKAYAELAHGYAQNGKVQQALCSISEARAIFPEVVREIPVFLSTDYGLFQVILFEGLSNLALANHEERYDNPSRAYDRYQEAASKLAQVDQLPRPIVVPERLRIEIINHQAAAAVGAGNMEEFEHYLLAGVAGAKALGSEKRRQEAVTVWRKARETWPDEQRIMRLADVFVDM